MSGASPWPLRVLLKEAPQAGTLEAESTNSLYGRVSTRKNDNNDVRYHSRGNLYRGAPFCRAFWLPGLARGWSSAQGYARKPWQRSRLTCLFQNSGMRHRTACTNCVCQCQTTTSRTPSSWTATTRAYIECFRSHSAMRIQSLILHAAGVLLTCNGVHAATSWGFSDATLTVQGKGSGVGSGLKEK
jgi:hypothetical protein